MHTVLIVEDNTWLCESYTRIVKAAGYRVIATAAADKAIDLIDDEAPDIILLDMLLPKTTAMALLHELQSHSDLARIPVILVTSMAHSLQLKDLLSYGVRKILDKETMKLDDMVEAIKEVLDENTSH